MVEYHWLEGQYNRLPSLMDELIRRRVAVIATPASRLGALAAKAATSTIPIVLPSAMTRSSWGWSQALPGQAAMRPASIPSPLRLWPSGLASCMICCPRQFVSLYWSIPRMLRLPKPRCEIYRKRQAPSDCKFECSTPAPAAKSRRPSPLGATPADALLVASDGFFPSRRVQFAVLAVRHAIPAIYATREYPEVGGLMSYGTDALDPWYQAGIYTGQILKGAKPADLLVLQSTKFEFVINMQTARALGIEVPNSIQLLADEVIE